MSKYPPRMRKSNLEKKLLLAETATQEANWDEAVKLWADVTETRHIKIPARAFSRLAQAYRMLKQYEKASEVLVKAKQQYEDYLPFYTEEAAISVDLQDWEEAVKHWEEIITKFSNDAPARGWARLSQAYRQENKLTEAGNAISDGLKKHPEEHSLILEAARLYSIQEDWENAAKYWLAAIEQDRSNIPVDGWINASRALRTLNKLSHSETLAAEGLEKYPNNSELLTELAEAYTADEHWDKALPLWEKIVEILPNTASTLRSHARFQVSIISRLQNIEEYKEKIAKYTKKPGRKIAIVTSVTKGYDKLKPHEFLDDRFEYVVYTDAKFGDMGIFDIRPLPHPELDGPRAVRYAKSHAHSLFKEHDLVVWIDANVMIVGDLFPLLEKFMASGKAIGANKHPLRNSIQEELQACIELKKEDPGIMKKQVAHYQSEGYKDTKLAECNFLAFNLRDYRAEVEAAMETWWEQICTFSRRDQLSFPYSLDKHGLDWFNLTKPPEGMRNHPAFIMSRHNYAYNALDKLCDTLSDK